MAGLNPLDRDNLGQTGFEADQGFSLDKPTDPLEQQVGADDELQRGLERVAALEAWLSAGRGQENGLNAIGVNRSDQIPQQQTSTQGIGVPQDQDRTLVVVDSRLRNWQQMAAGLPSDADLLLLDQSRSGLQQVEDAAQSAQREGTTYRAVALLGSQAEDGTVQFGNDDWRIKGTSDVNQRIADLKTGILVDADLRFFSGPGSNDIQTGSERSINEKLVRTSLGGEATSALDEARSVLREAITDGRTQDAVKGAFAIDNQSMATKKLKEFIDNKDTPNIRWANFEDQRIRGAFIQSTNTILISKGIEADAELINDVVLEEIGHWLESELGSDSSRDEGEIFKDIILGRERISTEKDDSTTLVIDGINYKAELSSNGSEAVTTGTTVSEIQRTVTEDSGPTPLNLDIDEALGSESDTQTSSTSVEVNKIPDQDLGSIQLSDGTNVKEGEVYTKAEAEGMLFEPSANANGQADLELTIRDGVEISSSEGTEISPEEIDEKELEILSDLNQDGVTGIKLIQEIYNPNSNSDNTETPPADSTHGDSTPPPAPAVTHNHSNKRYAYKNEDDGLVVTRNQINGLNLNSIYTSDAGEIEHEGPDVLKLTDSNGGDFNVPNGGQIASVLLKKTPSDSGSLHADSIEILVKENENINRYTFALDGQQQGTETTLTSSEILRINVKEALDLLGTGTVGTTISTELFNPTSNTAGYTSHDSQTRFVYNSPAGVVISKNALTIGDDLSKHSSISGTPADNTNGPEFTLVKKSDLDLAVDEAVVGVRRTINGFSNTGFELIISSTTNVQQKRIFAVDNDGLRLTTEANSAINPTDLRFRVLELNTGIDLDGDETNGFTITQSDIATRITS